MTNDEKLDYIKLMHELSIKYRVDDYPKDQQKLIVQEFKKIIKDKIFPIQPLKLYKYRRVNENNLSAIENDYAWFSLIKDVDDTVDSSINFDPEEEIGILEAEKGKLMFEYNLEIVKKIIQKFGVDVKEDALRMCLKSYDDGILNIESLNKLFEMESFSNIDKNYLLDEINKAISRDIPEDIKNATMSFITLFLDFNKSIKENIVAYCLSESSNIDLMWGTYADSSTGFCIEYTIPFDTNTLLDFSYRINLYPVYYGNKDRINVFDMLKKALFSDKEVLNGILVDDYLKMFISAYTKDVSWTAQQEWRITMNAGHSNKKYFPYITGIILGERMTENNRSKIIDICKRKNFPVYQRKLNIAHSKIIVEKICQ